MRMFKWCSHGGGNSISPMTNNVADGTTDLHNPELNYNDLGIPNSAGFYPYNKKGIHHMTVRLHLRSVQWVTS